jgi:hypothetical protein
VQTFTLAEGGDGAPDEECDDGAAGRELGAVEPVASTSSSLKGCYSGSAGSSGGLRRAMATRRREETTAVSAPVWGEAAGSNEKSQGRNHGPERKTEAFFHIRDGGCRR